jgi:hypothetical protein
VIQPNVVHTTVPIHEVHHNKATVHGTTALPAMTMDEFKNKGGVLSGREERYDEFEGVPKNIGGGTAGGFGHVRDTNATGHHTGSEHHSHGDFANAPNHAGTGGVASGLGHSTHASRDPTGNVARESTLSNTSSGTHGIGSGRHSGTDGVIGTGNSTGHRESGTSSDLPRALTEDKSRAHHESGLSGHDSTTQKKPSLIDRLSM